MIFKNLLELNGICQGDCIRAGDHQGVFIAKISERESVISAYNDKSPKYIHVPTKEVTPTDAKYDNRLLEFAQRHVLWHHQQRKEGKNVFINGKRKNDTKRNPDRKKGRQSQEARRNTTS